MGPSVHPSRLDDPRIVFGDAYGAHDESTGLRLTERDVLGWPAVLQACRLVSWSIGMTPCQLFEKTTEGTKKLKAAEDHPLHWILHDEPHPEYTPFEWKADIAFNAIFRGNWYGQKITTQGNAIQSVFPLDTNRMDRVDRINGRLKFTYREANSRLRVFDMDELTHVRGFADGGVLGLALQQLSPRTVAKGVAMDQFGAKVFKNGVLSTAIVEQDPDVKLRWTEDERKAFFDKLSDSISGSENWHKVIGLPGGMHLKSLGISAKEAQLVEGLTFQVQDVARLTGVPPSLLMDLSRATFSNVEQQMLQFFKLVLGPWFAILEQRFAKSLLTPEERRRYVIKFNPDAILRTTLKERYDAYRVAVGQPWMSVNEARDLEDMPSLGETGDVVMQPLNMTNPGGNPDNTEEPMAPPQDGDSGTRTRSLPSKPCQRRDCTHAKHAAPTEYRNAGRAGYLTAERREEVRDLIRERTALRDAFRRQIQRDATRLVKGEIREIKKLMDKHLDTRDAESLTKAVERYYEGEGTRGFMAAVNNILGDVLTSYAESMATAVGREMNQDAPDVSEFVRDYLTAFARRTAGSHLGQIKKLIEESDDPSKALERRLEEWEEEPASQAQKISDREVIQLGEAVVRAGLVALGVTRLAWAANSGACPICEEIDGQIVGVEEVFVEASGQVDPADDNVVPLRVERDVNHPPLHQGCECSLVAA